MNKNMRQLAILITACLMSIILVGCDAPHRSKIDVTLCKKAGAEESEENALRRLLMEKGYAIRERVEGDPFIKQELKGEKFSTLWRADKKYNPTVIFAQDEKHSTILLFQLSGPLRPKSITELTKEINSSLVSACGASGVVMQ